MLISLDVVFAPSSAQKRHKDKVPCCRRRKCRHLYVTTHYGTFRSDDGAASWHEISAGLPFSMTRPLALHPREPATVFVICHEDTPDAYLPVIRGQLLVHRSRDGGRSWQALADGLPQQESCAVLREALDIDDATPCGLNENTSKAATMLDPFMALDATAELLEALGDHVEFAFLPR
jgi:hypothetical protein